MRACFTLAALFTTVFLLLIPTSPTAWGQCGEGIAHASGESVLDLFGDAMAVFGDFAIVGAPGDHTNPGAAYVFRFDGTSWVREQKLVAPDGTAGDQFGRSVALTGDAVLIGAPEDDDNGDYAGSVYVFRFDGAVWVHEQKLLPADGLPWDLFGSSVGIHANVAVISSLYDNDNGPFSGSAYIFRFDGASWSQEAKLLAADGAPLDTFGQSVAMAEGVAMIGAPNNEDHTGAAYVFKHDGVGWSQVQKLVASDPTITARFGYSVASSGNTALIGAPLGRGNNVHTGSAYVFRFDGAIWIEVDKLVASDGVTFDQFGDAVGISGDVAVVGAFRANSTGGRWPGAAYVFQFDGTNWGQQARLFGRDARPISLFGRAVAVDDRTIMIGAGRHDPLGDRNSAIYAFEGSGANWVQEQILLSDIGVAGDLFGTAVAISGDQALIGAPGDDDTGQDAGAAYLAEADWMPNQWFRAAKFVAPDGEPGDQFGSAVALHDDTGVIGAFRDDDNGVDSGSAYVYSFGGANDPQVRKLLAPDGAADDEFGNDVGVRDDVTVIGAHHDDDNGSESGSAYVFRRDGKNWRWEQKLLPLDGASGDEFGSSVAITGAMVLLGAPGDDDLGENSGSVYVFRFDGASWELSQKLHADDGAANAEFGVAVAAFENTVWIGAPGDTHNGARAGAAYVFGYDGTRWTQAQKVLPADGSAGDEFGVAVGISANKAVVGAHLDDDRGTDSGSCYRFNLNGTNWVQIGKLLARDGQPFDEYGITAVITESVVVIGAPFNDAHDRDAGAAYFNGGRCVCGDMNCDGLFNGADINPFFLALGDPHTYATIFPFCDPLNGDMNGDGQLNGGDIDAFFIGIGRNCP